MRSRRSPLAVAFALLPILGGLSAVAGAPGCSSESGPACRVGADCASGACDANGRCVPASAASTGPTSSGTSTPDAGAPSTVDAGAKDGGGCEPNKDGIITRNEVPLEAGLHATFRVGQNEAVDTTGTSQPGGKRAWDFSGKLASDQDVVVETEDLNGKWYASSFSGATYATRLSQSADLDGVFETSPGAILLRGVVSPDDGATKTQLTNDPAVSVLTFPFGLNTTWTSTANVTGTAQGIVTVPYTEKYESTVDAIGTLETPLATFDVLRVRTLLTRTFPNATFVTIRSFAWVSECYGTVATVSSNNYEANEEFSQAAEIRRIAP